MVLNRKISLELAAQDAATEAELERLTGRPVSRIGVYRAGLEAFLNDACSGKVVTYKTLALGRPRTSPNFTENMCAERPEAKAAGDRYYLTGRPCKAGHVTVRFTSSGACLDCHTLRKALDRPVMYAARRKEYWSSPERITGVRKRKFWTEYDGPKKEIKALDVAIAIAEQAAKE